MGVIGNLEVAAMFGSGKSFSSLSVTSCVDRLLEIDSNLESELHEYPVEDIPYAPESGWLGGGAFHSPSPRFIGSASAI